MDARSHELFAAVLLNAVDRTTISPQWGNAPDIDKPFLHRWRRHRISVMQKTYYEFPRSGIPELSDIPLPTKDRDAVTLCIAGHLYLDIFNGAVFPFGFWHPIFPDETIISDVLDDIDAPKIFIKALERLTGEEPFLQEFYRGSKELMQRLIVPGCTVETLTAQFVQRLAFYADHDLRNRNALYHTAMKQIAGFTGNSRYMQGSIYPNQTHNVCGDFEAKYAKLIEAMEE